MAKYGLRREVGSLFYYFPGRVINCVRITSGGLDLCVDGERKLRDKVKYEESETKKRETI